MEPEAIRRAVRAPLAAAMSCVVALAALLVVPTSPTEVVLLSLSVLALAAGLAAARLPVAVLAAPSTLPACHRRVVPALADRVTDAKRSPRAPRAPGLV